MGAGGWGGDRRMDGRSVDRAWGRGDDAVSVHSLLLRTTLAVEMTSILGIEKAMVGGGENIGFSPTLRQPCLSRAIAEESGPYTKYDALERFSSPQTIHTMSVCGTNRLVLALK